MIAENLFLSRIALVLLSREWSYVWVKDDTEWAKSFEESFMEIKPKNSITLQNSYLEAGKETISQLFIITMLYQFFLDHLLE